MKNVLENETCDQSRRKILKKAYVAPVVVALGTMTLSSPAEAMSKKGGGSNYAENGSSSSHQNRNTKRYHVRSGSSSLHQDNGWGNGDDTAPGGSKPHNKAENDEGGKIHDIHGPSNSN